MLGIHFTGEAPFEIVYLSGLVRDPYGQKMSKTKGNVVDPLEAIDESGADALRFALIHGAAPGNDQKFSAEKLENARNFANKLWNAARFVLGARPATIAAGRAAPCPDPSRLGPAERWLRSRVAATVAAVDRGDGRVRLRRADPAALRRDLERVLRLGPRAGQGPARRRARSPAAEREATWWTLVEALDTLPPAAPPGHAVRDRGDLGRSCPTRPDDPELLIVADWPDAGRLVGRPGPAAEAAVDRLRDLVRAIRNARVDGTARARRLAGPATWSSRPSSPRRSTPCAGHRAPRPAAARSCATPIGASFDAAERPGSLAVIAGDLEARIGADASDVGAGAAERTRLERELAEAERFLAAARARLANDAFSAKAPPAIVEGARAREAELADQVARLRARLAG